jgi:hypothetical protein
MMFAAAPMTSMTAGVRNVDCDTCGIQDVAVKTRCVTRVVADNDEVGLSRSAKERTRALQSSGVVNRSICMPRCSDQ